MSSARKKMIVDKRQIYRRVAETLSSLNMNVDGTNVSILWNLNLHMFLNNCKPNSNEFSTEWLDKNYEQVTDLTSYNKPLTDETLDKFISYNTFNNEMSLVNKLKNWAIFHNNLPCIAITHFLKILYPFYPELPLDCRTLLKTPKTKEIIILESGEYFFEFIPICNIALSVIYQILKM